MLSESKDPNGLLIAESKSIHLVSCNGIVTNPLVPVCIGRLSLIAYCSGHRRIGCRIKTVVEIVRGALGESEFREVLDLEVNVGRECWWWAGLRVGGCVIFRLGGFGWFGHGSGAFLNVEKNLNYFGWVA